MSDIIVQNIVKRYGALSVLNGFSHTFQEGRVYCVMGPSGCGKTTLLRLIAGLETPDEGSIAGIAAQRVSFAFQEDRLIPHFSAAKNVELVLPDRARIRAALERIGLSGSLDKPVSELSGGMARRVALVRAALFDASIVLLDEPFKGLDSVSYKATLAFIKEECRTKTLICVTHSAEEAADISGEIVKIG